MKAILSIVLLSFTLPVCAQTAPAVSNSNEITLEQGFPVKVKLMQEITSKKAQAGDKVNFEVADPVIVDSRVLIPSATPALGTIDESERSKILGKKGTLSFSVDEIIMTNGHIIKLSLEQKAAGKQKLGAAIAESALLTPLFLLKKGKNVDYKAGTIFTAYVAQDYKF